MKIKRLKLNVWTKMLLLTLAVFLNFSSGQIGFLGFKINAQQVLLDSHSAANGLATWNITTTHPNELIIISAGGYGTSNLGIPSTPGTVTVNGNNATYISEGSWISGDVWCESIWAYAAPTAGTYTCVCAETNIDAGFYLNFASSVYQPNCPTGLGLDDIVVGGVDSNHGPTTITATITTTENGSWIYGTIDNNDNGGSGTVAWNNQLTKLNYTYSINDGVDGAQADSTYALAGTYTITSTDVGASNVWMSIALIAVQPNATCCNLTATGSIKSNVSCNGGSNGSAFGTPARGHAPYTYSWAPHGQTTDTVTGLSAGTYTITISDTIGCSATAGVTISQPSPISPTIALADIICSTQTESGIANVTGGTSLYTYSWSTVPAQNKDTATGLSAGTYTLVVTDSHGCTNTAGVTVNPIPVPNPIITGQDTICLGSSTTLTVSGANSYVWNPGGNTGSTFTARAPVTIVYTVTGTSNGCTKDTTVKITVVPVPRPVIHASKDSVCQGDTLTLSASGGTLYHWAPGGQSSATIHVTLSNATTYTLYASGGTCEDSATQTIKVIKLLKAAAKATPDTVCPNTLVNIIAAGTGGNVTYSWNTGATTSGIPVRDTVTTTYTVTVHGTCDDTVIPVTVYVVPLPSIKVKGDHFECAGAEDTLTVSSITNPTTYSWSNGETGTRIIPTINGAQIYTVTAMNSLGCTVTDTFSVKEQSYPQVSLNYPTACGSGELSIIATASGNGPFTYKWSTGGTYDTVNVYIDNDKTVYTVTVSNGCKVSVVDTVIEDNPQMFACCDAKIYLGGDTELVASGLEITNYQWTPANSGLSCYTCPNPIASPSVTTTYTVSGKDSAGCPIERTITITVETPCNNFIVPNVFTPTNAGALGLDNILYIQATNFSSWSLIIYDRWGHEVYKSMDDTKYWDGKNEGGTDSPEGVYYYVIDASCISGSFQKEGFIQLIR